MVECDIKLPIWDNSGGSGPVLIFAWICDIFDFFFNLAVNLRAERPWKGIVIFFFLNISSSGVENRNFMGCENYFQAGKF